VNGMVKAWLAIIIIYACAIMSIILIHDRHDSTFLSAVLAIIAVPVCTMIGERLFRFF
jgi:hypothetical protein